MIPRGNSSKLAWLLAVSLLATLSGLRADDLAVQGRKVFDQYKEAVVTVELVIKSKFSVPGMNSQGRESKSDVTGTVVDPSGLTVVSLTTTDPSQVFQNFMGSAMSGGGSRFKMDTELTDVKILLADGTELPAEVVLRDKDLDMAFIRPKTKPAKPMTAVDPHQGGTAQLLDQVVLLNRLGKVTQRAYSASLSRINAIVERPKRFYIPDGGLAFNYLGSPVFTLDGKFLGICLLRSMKSEQGGGFSMMSMFNSTPGNMTAIILPAKDIANSAEQAPPPSAGSSGGSDSNP